MADEFRASGPNTAISTRGFTVRWIPPGEIRYQDAAGSLRVDAEVLSNPVEILVYPNSGDLRGASREREYQVLSDVARALKYLGHPTDEPGVVIPAAGEFMRPDANTAVSCNGFTVQTGRAEVIYEDRERRVVICAEWRGEPKTAVLYLGPLPADRRTAKLVSNLMSALKYLGFGIEIHPNESFPLRLVER